MRIVIENSVRRQIMRIVDWFCEQECIDHHTARIEAETEKAILLNFVNKQIWVPKSLITIYDATKPKGLEEW